MKDLTNNPLKKYVLSEDKELIDDVQFVVDKVYPHIVSNLGPSEYVNEPPTVELWEDIYARVSGIPGMEGEESESSKAQYEDHVNKIFIYYPNMVNTEDVIRALLHEYTHSLQDPDKKEENRKDGYEMDQNEVEASIAELNWKDYLKYLTTKEQIEESKNPFGLLSDDWKEQIINHEKNLSTNELKYKKLADNLDGMVVTIPVNIIDGESPIIGITDITFTVHNPYIFQGLSPGALSTYDDDYVEPGKEPTVIKYDLVFMGVKPGSFLEELIQKYESYQLVNRPLWEGPKTVIELLRSESYSINEELINGYFKLYGISDGRIQNIVNPPDLPYNLTEQTNTKVNPELMVGDEITVVDVDKSYGPSNTFYTTTMKTPKDVTDYVVTGIKYRQLENWESPHVDTKYYTIVPIGGYSDEEAKGRMLDGDGRITEEQLYTTDTWILRKGFLRGELNEQTNTKVNPELMIGDEIMVVSTEGIHDFGSPVLYKPYVVVGIKHAQRQNWQGPETDTTYYQIEPIGMTDEERTGAMLAGGGRARPLYIFPPEGQFDGSDQWILRKGFLKGELNEQIEDYDLSEMTPALWKILKMVDNLLDGQWDYVELKTVLGKYFDMSSDAAELYLILKHNASYGVKTGVGRKDIHELIINGDWKNIKIPTLFITEFEHYAGEQEETQEDECIDGVAQYTGNDCECEDYEESLITMTDSDGDSYEEWVKCTDMNEEQLEEYYDIDDEEDCPCEKYHLDEYTVYWNPIVGKTVLSTKPILEALSLDDWEEFNVDEDLVFYYSDSFLVIDVDENVDDNFDSSDTWDHFDDKSGEVYDVLDEREISGSESLYNINSKLYGSSQSINEQIEGESYTKEEFESAQDLLFDYWAKHGPTIDPDSLKLLGLNMSDYKDRGIVWSNLQEYYGEEELNNIIQDRLVEVSQSWEYEYIVTTVEPFTFDDQSITVQALVNGDTTIPISFIDGSVRDVSLWDISELTEDSYEEQLSYIYEEITEDLRSTMVDLPVDLFLEHIVFSEPGRFAYLLANTELEVLKEGIEGDKSDEDYPKSFTKTEVRILNYLSKQFTLRELTDVATEDETQIGSDLSDKWVKIIKLFGEDPQDYNRGSGDEGWIRSTRWAKWALDNWSEACDAPDDVPCDYKDVTNPIKSWPSRYEVDGDESYWQKEFASGTIEIGAYDASEAKDRANDSWYEYDPDMEHYDYGDRDNQELEIGNVRHVKDLNEQIDEQPGLSPELTYGDTILVVYIDREREDGKTQYTTPGEQMKPEQYVRYTVVDKNGNGSQSKWPFKYTLVPEGQVDEYEESLDRGWGNYEGYEKLLYPWIYEWIFANTPTANKVDRLTLSEHLKGDKVSPELEVDDIIRVLDIDGEHDSMPERFGVYKVIEIADSDVDHRRYYYLQPAEPLKPGYDISSSPKRLYRGDTWIYANVDIKTINEHGADDKWSDDDDTVTLQEILELTKDIPIIPYPTKDLEFKVLGWEDSPEEIERISQVEVSRQYPILIMVNEYNDVQWILDGNHRAQQALMNDIPTIPAKLIKPSDLDERTLKMFYPKGIPDKENKQLNEHKKTNVNTELMVGDIVRVIDVDGEHERMPERFGVYEVVKKGMIDVYYDLQPYPVAQENMHFKNGILITNFSLYRGDTWVKLNSVDKFKEGVKNLNEQEEKFNTPLIPGDVIRVLDVDKYTEYLDEQRPKDFHSPVYRKAYGTDDSEIENLETISRTQMFGTQTLPQPMSLYVVLNSVPGGVTYHPTSNNKPYYTIWPVDQIKKVVDGIVTDEIEFKVKPRKQWDETILTSNDVWMVLKKHKSNIPGDMEKKQKEYDDSGRDITSIRLDTQSLTEETDIFGQGLMDPIEPEEFDGTDEEWEELMKMSDNSEETPNYEYSDGKTDPEQGFVAPSKEVTSNICAVEGFCQEQGPITFGQLKSLVEAATSKRVAGDIGRGVFKTLWRLIPFFIPQILLAAVGVTATRAINKVVTPALKDTKGYKSWWGKAVLKAMDIAEGDYIPDIALGDDPLGKVFFISDGLLMMIRDKYKLKFARYVADIASSKPQSEPVPDWFVENLLRDYLNQKFLLDPPLPIKTQVDKDSINEQVNSPKQISPDLEIGDRIMAWDLIADPGRNNGHSMEPEWSDFGELVDSFEMPTTLIGVIVDSFDNLDSDSYRGGIQYIVSDEVTGEEYGLYGGWGHMRKDGKLTRAEQRDKWIILPTKKTSKVEEMINESGVILPDGDDSGSKPQIPDSFRKLLVTAKFTYTGGWGRPSKIFILYITPTGKIVDIKKSTFTGSMPFKVDQEISLTDLIKFEDVSEFDLQMNGRLREEKEKHMIITPQKLHYLETLKEDLEPADLESFLALAKNTSGGWQGAKGRKKVFMFLDALRDSGIINMFQSVDFLHSGSRWLIKYLDLHHPELLEDVDEYEDTSLEIERKENMQYLIDNADSVRDVIIGVVLAKTKGDDSLERATSQMRPSAGEMVKLWMQVK